MSSREGNWLMADVNSLMQGNAKAGPPAPTAASAAGQKRAAPEEGEIAESAPVAGPAQGQRNLKRPKKDESVPAANNGNVAGNTTRAGATDNAGASGGDDSSA